MKKVWLTVMIVCLLALLPVMGLAADLTIMSAADLQSFAASVNSGNNYAGKVVELGANIDLAGIEWQPIGGDSVHFAGEFDGNGYTIYNLTNTQDVARKGLFGLVENAYLHDFNLKNVKFSGTATSMRVGAVAGNLQYWNVLENITIDGLDYDLVGTAGSSQSDMIGGVAGYEWKSQMKNVVVKNADFNVSSNSLCVGGAIAYGRAHVWDAGVTGNNQHWLPGTVIDGYVLQNYAESCTVSNIKIVANGSGDVGGFIGSDTYNSHSNYFKNCKVTGLDMQLQGTGTYAAGGFMAYNNGTTDAVFTSTTVKGFAGCSAQGKITGTNGTYGGFVGYVGGRASSFENASADVDIVSNGVAGGFVGQTAQYFTHKYTFTNCTARGDVQGDIVGGFAGEATLGGDGDQINVEYNNCASYGDAKGRIAGGFLGMTDPELPATNWSIVEGTGNLTASGCSAMGNVQGTEYTASFVGLGNTLSVGDAKEGTKTILNLQGILVKNKQLPVVGRSLLSCDEHIFISFYNAPASLPKTGDSTPIVLCAVLMAMSLAGMLFISRGKKMRAAN